MSRPAFVWSPAYEVDIGKHVFPTQKFRLLKELMVERGLVGEHEIEEPPAAIDAELLAVLSPDYLADLSGGKHTERTRRSELALTQQIVHGMRVTAGGTLLGARRAIERGLACHFGGGYHHAYADHAEGFCYINDIAVAIEVLRREGLIKRAAVVDVDVHQGNGTAAIFRDNPDVYTFSIHQENLYPNPKEKGSLDIGLVPPISGEEYLEELESGLRLAIDRHQPDLVIYAAGVDTYREDVLGKLGLDWETMRRRDRMVAERVLGQGTPLLTVVSGGYSTSVATTVALHALTVEQALGAFRASRFNRNGV